MAYAKGIAPLTSDTGASALKMTKKMLVIDKVIASPHLSRHEYLKQT